MMKRLAIAAALTAVMITSVKAEAEDQGRGEIKWTRTICVEKDCYIGWPSICRIKNGDLIAVFSGDRELHVCPWGKVQMVRSTDDGETWSEPITIANGPMDDRDAGIVQMPDGEIIVTYFTSREWTLLGRMDRHPEWKRHFDKLPKGAIEREVGNFLVRSRDDGKTWSKPEKIGFPYAQTPHGPILLKDGSLLQIGRYSKKNNGSTYESGRTTINVSKSGDAGRTWEELCAEVPAQNGENDATCMFHEPHVCELADGTLVGVVRYHGVDDELSSKGNGYMRLTRSTDGGRTWSPMAKTPMLGLPPHLMVLPDGKVVCVYGRRNGKPDFGEFACISDDGGKTWDAANEITLTKGVNGDLGYPASAMLPNGDIVTVYYQVQKKGEKSVLMATKWRVRR